MMSWGISGVGCGTLDAAPRLRSIVSARSSIATISPAASCVLGSCTVRARLIKSYRKTKSALADFLLLAKSRQLKNQYSSLSFPLQDHGLIARELYTIPERRMLR